MEITKILIVAVAACICTVIVSQYKPEFSLFIQLTAVAVITLMFSEPVIEIFSQTQQLANKVSTGNSYIKILFKAVAIAVAGKVVSDVCLDTGNKAVSTCVDFACRFSIMLLALPLLKVLASLAADLIKQ